MADLTVGISVACLVAGSYLPWWVITGHEDAPGHHAVYSFGGMHGGTDDQIWAISFLSLAGITLILQGIILGFYWRGTLGTVVCAALISAIGSAITALALKIYQEAATSTVAGVTVHVEVGAPLMMAGGFLGFVGGILQIFTRQRRVAGQPLAALPGGASSD